MFYNFKTLGMEEEEENGDNLNEVVGALIDADKGGKPKRREPSLSDYAMHFLSVPWKLLFATIPPTGKQIRIF